MPKKRYLVVVEKAKNGYSAYVPDCPAVIVTGLTLEEVEQGVKTGFTLAFNLDKGEEPPLAPERLVAPEPTTQALWVDIDFPEDMQFADPTELEP